MKDKEQNNIAEELQRKLYAKENNKELKKLSQKCVVSDKIMLVEKEKILAFMVKIIKWHKNNYKHRKDVKLRSDH